MFKHTNVVIAAFTTAQARLELYKYLERLGCRILYCDTDSCIFVVNEESPNEYIPELGNFLGQMTDELTEYGNGAYITHFLSGGPKFYTFKGIKPNGETFEKCKIKGIRLNYANGKHINFDSILKLINKEIETIEIKYRSIRRTAKYEIITTDETKTVSVVLTKRSFLPDGTSLPFGYKSV